MQWEKCANLATPRLARGAVLVLAGKRVPKADPDQELDADGGETVVEAEDCAPPIEAGDCGPEVE